MEPATQTPAGRAIGSGSQGGPLKALTLEPSPLLREGSKVEGGIVPKVPKIPPEEVHSPMGTQGKDEAVPHSLNPPRKGKDKTSAPLGESQVMSPTHPKIPSHSGGRGGGGLWG
jgi:hypothetical protein